MKGRSVLTARDIMTTSLVTFRPDMTMLDALQTLTRKGISGAPVIDAEDHLIGILSEMDCLRAVASGEFFSEEHYEETAVQQYMTKAAHLIQPETGIYRIAQVFRELPIRRLPVVDDGVLLGQVSRRDVLKGILKMRSQRLPKKRYPDYPAEREPMG